MVGQLRHEKGFADLGSAHKEVHPRIEQALYDRGPAGEHSLVEVIHGEGGQIVRGAGSLQLPQHFLQIFLRGLVFVKILCYTLVRFL